ncbi:MAG: DUF1365 domain-containing protein [Gammaproteobacteria bacterium]|nr:DUF1365 domain-containing protein [Gammaproteobacteria bacterium]
MNADGTRIYNCRIMHRRAFPVRYRFSYRVFALLLDLDELNATCARIPFFSHNRRNLVAFYDRDHGPRDGSGLREWLNGLLAAHDLHDACAKVLLLSMPRIFGYVFNPLSIYYCFDAERQLRAIVCEVKNTFGEQHCYVLHEGNEPMAFPVTKTGDKAFHVSPFMAIEGSYAFRLSAPEDTLSICIKHINENGTQLVAVQRGDASECTTVNLLKAVARTPLMTLKVICMIHWRALRIWLSGAPFYKKPPAPIEESS